MSASDRRAALSLGWLAVLAVVVLGLALLGVALGMQSLLISTKALRAAIRCCGTIVSRCLISPSLLRATLPWFGMLILAFGLGRAAVNLARSLWLNWRFLRELGGREAPPSAALLEAAQRAGVVGHLTAVELEGRRAFVAGIWRPRIYVSEALCQTLDAAELQAVLLHEDHHRAARDPLRALVIDALQDVLFFLPVGRVLHGAFLEAREHAADEAVARRGGGSLDLASALCRLARLGGRPDEPALLARLLGRGVVQARVERLLGGACERARPSAGSWIVSGAVLLLMLVCLYLPLLMTSSPFVFQGCTPDICPQIGCGPR